ncbi:hypothetical protein ACFLSS_01410 [Bacteroidota bacterium]
MVLIISYTLYKIRNQAKTKNLGYFDRTGNKIPENDVLPGTELQQDQNKVYNNDSEKVGNRIFVVETKKKGINQIQPLPFDHQPNIYKFYEEFNSKIMFKIKPGVNAE